MEKLLARSRVSQCINIGLSILTARKHRRSQTQSHKLSHANNMSTPTSNLDGQVQDIDEMIVEVPARNTPELESIDEDNALVLYEAPPSSDTVMTFGDDEEQEVQNIQESDEQQYANTDSRSEIERSYTPIPVPYDELQQPVLDPRQPFVGYQHRIVTLHECRPVIQQRTITDDGDNQVQYTYAGSSQVYYSGNTDVSH